MNMWANLIQFKLIEPNYELGKSGKNNSKIPRKFVL